MMPLRFFDEIRRFTMHFYAVFRVVRGTVLDDRAFISTTACKVSTRRAHIGTITDPVADT